MQLIPPQLTSPRPHSQLSNALRFTTNDGAQLACFIYGELKQTHKAVLMLHGNGGRHLGFGPIVDACIAEGRAVIALDSRGQGKSTRGQAPLTYELMAADACFVLDQLGIDMVHVLGYSDGGIEALLLARDYAKRIASITVLGANLTPEGVVDSSTWDIAGDAEQLRAWATHAWSKDIDTSLLTPTPQEAAVQAELLQLMLDEPHIDAASLSTISCPTTVVVGEFDCIRDDETVAIVKAIKQARLTVVPDVGHSLPKGAPYAVIRELLATIALAQQ